VRINEPVRVDLHLEHRATTRNGGPAAASGGQEFAFVRQKMVMCSSSVFPNVGFSNPDAHADSWRRDWRNIWGPWRSAPTPLRRSDVAVNFDVDRESRRINEWSCPPSCGEAAKLQIQRHSS